MKKSKCQLAETRERPVAAEHKEHHVAQTSRNERIIADLDSLNKLKSSSTIFDFEATGDVPERFTIIFRGKGVARNTSKARDLSAHRDPLAVGEASSVSDTSAARDVEIIERHQCDIRLPYSYPERGPDIRWLTALFHPNVSFSGFINLNQIGLPWESGITLDVVVERLWDVARGAYLNLTKATNYAAKNWYEDECTLRLPVDQRPLRDKSAAKSSNVIRYERRAGHGVDLAVGRHDPDVFYIGDDTPLPDTKRSPQQTARNDDDDILYIG